MASAIEEIIEELEAYIDSCKPATFSSTKIVVNRDEIDVLLSDLKAKTPEEIRQYQKIISNKEAILADAKRKADEMLQRTQIQTDQLLSEHQIMQQAYVRANEVVMIANKKAQEILDSATMDANQIREGAMAYTDDMLKQIQEVMDISMDTTQKTLGTFMQTMKQYYEIVRSNRMELSPQSAMEESMSQDIAYEAPGEAVPEGAEVEHTNEHAPEENHVTHENNEQFVDTLQDDVSPINIPDQFFAKD